MYQRRRSRVLLAVLVLVSLVLITIDFRSENGPLDRIRAVATAVFEPIQDGLATVVRPVGDALGSVRDVLRLRSENERLRTRIEALENRRQSFADLERENADLRALLGMDQREGFETVVARTVALAPSNYEWTVTLDVGSADGVEENMVVINGDGLVGRVIQVTTNASRVLLAIDPNFSASARTAADGEVGAIDGKGGDLMRFQPLDPEAPIEVGDEVVTNQYENGLFPPGIPIGSVEEVGEATTLLNRDVLVRPYVDFTRLHHVLVVLEAPVEAPPPATEGPDPSFEPPRLVPSPTPEPTETPTPSAEDPDA